MSDRHAAIIRKNKICATRPELRAELLVLIELADNEIDEGGSADHEWELCISAMQDLVA